jgi:hypothetical protein
LRDDARAAIDRDVVRLIGECERIASGDRQRRARACCGRRARADVVTDEQAVFEDVHAFDEWNREVGDDRIRDADEAGAVRTVRAVPGALPDFVRRCRVLRARIRTVVAAAIAAAADAVIGRRHAKVHISAATAREHCENTGGDHMRFEFHRGLSGFCHE